jgi:PAS domain S-box-containing protein
VQNVRIVTFPRDDLAFEAHVSLARQQMDNWDSAALIDRVRAAYPLARAKLADRAALLDPLTDLWYVFRDGSIRPRSRELSWANEPHVARAVLDPQGRYIDANEAAAELFGVSCDDIIGRAAGSFTSHEPEPELGDQLLGIAEQKGGLESTAVVNRPNGEAWPIEFVVRPMRDGGHVVAMRRALGSDAGTRPAAAEPVEVH